MPFYVHTLVVHFIKIVLSDSRFLIFLIALWIFLCMSPGICVPSFSWEVYQGVELLNWWKGEYLSAQDNLKSFQIDQSNVYTFPSTIYVSFSKILSSYFLVFVTYYIFWMLKHSYICVLVMWKRTIFFYCPLLDLRLRLLRKRCVSKRKTYRFI